MLYLIISLPILFILHDGEEIVVQNGWMERNGNRLIERFPKARKMIEHLMQLSSLAFSIAVAEELAIITFITVYLLAGGPFAVYLWTAIFMAFSLHLFVHIAQAIVFRGYVPGVLTSLLLLPYGIIGTYLLWQQVGIQTLVFCAVGGLLFTAVNLMLSHWMGIKLDLRVRHS